MRESCKICRRDIEPGDGTLMEAFGRPLFVVHTTCAPVVHSGMRAVSSMALLGARLWMRKKAPGTLAFVDTAMAQMKGLGQ